MLAMVLGDGRIVEQGGRDDLTASGSGCARLLAAQVGGYRVEV